MNIHCIACGYQIVCPCETCRQRRKYRNDQTKPWRWLSEFRIQCPNCGFYASSTYWSTLEDTLMFWQEHISLNDVPEDYTQETLIALDTVGGKGYHNTNQGD